MPHLATDGRSQSPVFKMLRNSHKDFPWFAEASIQDLVAVDLPSPHHLYWPALDIDLAVDSLDHPERFQLVSRKHQRSRVSLLPAYR